MRAGVKTTVFAIVVSVVLVALFWSMRSFLLAPQFGNEKAISGEPNEPSPSNRAARNSPSSNSDTQHNTNAPLANTGKEPPDRPVDPPPSNGEKFESAGLTFFCEGGSIRRFMNVSPPSEARWRGKNPGVADDWDEPKRRVHGVVLKTDGDKRTPVNGVLVFDWQDRHRTFTNSEGVFEFDAFVNISEENGKWEAFLGVSHLGYGFPFPGGGSWFPEAEFNTPRGVELVVEKTTAFQSIRVEFVNPEIIKGPVTVLLGAKPDEKSIRSDEARYLEIESRGAPLVIRTPVPMFLLAVSGEGWRVAHNGFETTHDRKAAEVRYRVTLESCDNYLVSGTVSSMRDNVLIYGATVRGRDKDECCVTNEEGSFSFWLSRTSRDKAGKLIPWTEQVLEVCHPGYVGIRRAADPFVAMEAEHGTATSGPGGRSEGPWLIQLRPIVRVELKFTQQELVSMGPARLKLNCADIDENQRLRKFVDIDTSKINSIELPWGIKTVGLYGQRVVAVTLEEESNWAGVGLYRVEATR